MVDAGPYILSLALLAVLALSLGFSAMRLRQRLMPDWQGAPARLVEAITAIALLIWLSQLLGVVGLFYAWALVAASLVVVGAILLWTGGVSPAGGVAGGVPHSGGRGSVRAHGGAGRDRTRGPELLTSLVAIGVVAVVFAHWGLTTADALGRGMFNFDSLWYHMPFAVEMAQSHSVTGLHYPETVFTNWFYPQNSELLHAVGILLTERDTLSLFLNFGWLAIAFLAAWCIGRPHGLGALTVVAAAILLASHTLVVREPGAAKNDIMAAALLLAAIAILINAWTSTKRASAVPFPPMAGERNSGAGWVGWPLAAAGLAVGLAVGTKVTVLAMAAALSVAVVVLAPAGRRWAAAGWWFLPAFAAGGFWYLRNLIVAGNPLPQVESLGPISLPHPEQLQSGRPDFSIAHYATDTGVWREYFGPGLEHAFGVLWPLVTVGAIAGGLLAVLWGRERVLRWVGGVVLFGLLAYLFTPLGAAGPEGTPDAFRINLRFAVPALLAGLALLPVALLARGRSAWSWASWAFLGVLLLTLAVTDRIDAVLRDPDRLFGWLIALLFVLIPAALLYARSRGAPRGGVIAGFVALALAVAAIGYPLQRDYLDDRFANRDPETAIPGMGLDSAYRWAGEMRDARIGLAGTTAGFLQYGLYGTDLSNRVRYLGARGPHGAFNPIPTCAEFRAAVNEAGLDYLVTAPFLNFIEPSRPVPSPEAGWLRAEPAVASLDRSGAVTVWKVNGSLDPSACGPPNAPLRQIPQQPTGRGGAPG